MPHAPDFALDLKNVYHAYIILPVINTFEAVSIWITVTAAAERYFVVAFPIKSRNICKDTYARGTILTLILIALFLNFPYFFYKRISDKNELAITYFGNSKSFKVFARSRLFLQKVIPILALSILNGLLLKAIYDVSKRRQHMLGPKSRQTTKQIDQYRLTKILITISFVFVVCHLAEPFARSEVYKTLFGENSLQTCDFIRFRFAANLLELISFSTNIFLYCICNKTFAEIVVEKLRCRSNVGKCIGRAEKYAISCHQIPSIIRNSNKKHRKLASMKEDMPNCVEARENGVVSTYL